MQYGHLIARTVQAKTVLEQYDARKKTFLAFKFREVVHHIANIHSTIQGLCNNITGPDRVHVEEDGPPCTILKLPIEARKYWGNVV